MDIIIKPVETMEEIDGIVEIQRSAWEMNDIGIIPNFETRAVADAGFVYVAKEKDNRVIGFIYGYHHFPYWHYSHMMAVLPEYQGQNIGFLLKKYHREQILKSDFFVEGIKWTVDPLLPNNAYLNFAKLGCITNTYKINYYGDPNRDGVAIYAGVPTDRFLVEWPVHSQRVEHRMSNYKTERVSLSDLLDRSPVINEIDAEDRSHRIVEGLPLQFSVEVPARWQILRRDRIEIAKDWRLKFRNICDQAFQKGYYAIDYHSIEDKEKRRNFYEFSKNKPE